MGDLRDVSQAGDGTKTETEATETMEAVEIETEQNADQAVEDQTLAINAKMAAMLMNPLQVLPKPIRRSIRALKNLQLKHVHKEADFFKELHALEIKYEKIFDSLYEKRAAIISGAVIPTDEECEFLSEAEKELELSNEIDKIKLEKGDGEESEEDIKGIPEFWLVALRNAPAIADMIEEYDEPILKHLINIKATTSLEPMSFVLEFHFEPNEYFINSVLTKYYELRCAPDEADPFAFEGPEIVKCQGCQIEWKKGKNVTVKTIKKKQKHKARGAVRTVTKTVSNDSFFNFFSPPAAPENEDEEMDEETQGVLNNDFEVGNLIKDRLIPHAVLFFTGENLIDEDFDEEDEEDEDEYDEDEDEEDDDDENDGQCVTRKKSRGQTGGTQPQAPPECKQQ